MGVSLTPSVLKDVSALADLRGRRLAVDTNSEHYQFLALIRLPDGMPLKDAHGRITSHLSGLFFRVTRLIADGLQLVFVFDGRPPAGKPRRSTAAGPFASATRACCSGPGGRRSCRGVRQVDDDVASDRRDGRGGSGAAETAGRARVGTDFHPGIHGIGPKKALALFRFGQIYD